MPYQGEQQTLTKQSMRHQVCLSETCYITISEPADIRQSNGVLDIPPSFYT